MERAAIHGGDDSGAALGAHRRPAGGKRDDFFAAQALGRAMRIASVTSLCLATCAAIGSGAALAQHRDPTQPPPSYGTQAAAPANPLEGFRPEHLVMVDGRRYVMWHGRRLA